MKNEKTLKFVLYSHRNSTAIITLNRPEKRNALNNELIKELIHSLEMAEKDKNIFSIILTGKGDTSFCSGTDLNQEKLGVPGQYEFHLRKFYHPVIHKLISIDKPVIAAVNGTAAGAGIGFVLACDYIIMSECAGYYVAFSKIGLIPDSGVLPFLVRRLGKYKTFELSAFSKSINSAEALNLGLANEVVKPGILLKRTMQLCEQLNKSPHIAISLLKKILNSAEDLSLEELLDMECRLQEIVGSSEDHLEGVKAFLEKREPDFRGH